MKKLDDKSYEVNRDGLYYGLITLTEKGWVCKLWCGPATLGGTSAFKEPAEAYSDSLKLLDKLYSRLCA